MKEYLVIDDWYEEDTFKKVIKELDYLSCTPMVRSEDGSDSAKTTDGVSKAKSFRVYPEELYTDKGCAYSPILSSLKKMQQKDFHDKVSDTFKNTGTALAEGFTSTNASSTIISYYENNDKYDEHYDVFQYTVLIWVYKEPKLFKGGDLVFPKLNETVECKNNRMILFPSFYYHAVTPIKMETNKENCGRYAITHFFYRKF